MFKVPLFFDILRDISKKNHKEFLSIILTECSVIYPKGFSKDDLDFYLISLTYFLEDVRNKVDVPERVNSAYLIVNGEHLSMLVLPNNEIFYEVESHISLSIIEFYFNKKIDNIQKDKK